MLLRSSSTPMLGSLMAESPNSSHHHNQQQHHFYCCLSPLSDSSPTSSGVRRTRSDGNLHSLLSGDHHPRSNPVLETIPSFSVYNSNKHPQAEQEDELQVEEEEEEDEVVEEEEGDKVLHHEFSFSGGNKQGPLFLARGLGIDRLGSGMMNYSAGGERSEMEMYYKKMVDEEPSNALVLRNYAQFLFETKGDLERAEEYYSRAILAGPGDGEVLAQYAKVVWELHRDEERACDYFEQAVQAAPHDSHVAAAYAVFLWETEDDGGDDHYNGGQVSYGALASASATA